MQQTMTTTTAPADCTAPALHERWPLPTCPWCAGPRAAQERLRAGEERLARLRAGITPTNPTGATR